MGGRVGGGMGGRVDGWVYEAYEVKKKGKITLSFTSPEKENICFIFMM
jgi:hypothetical protein